jgi:hypothetical protein
LSRDRQKAIEPLFYRILPCVQRRRDRRSSARLWQNSAHAISHCPAISLFEELKRRNVFRVGVADAVTAWVLLQTLEVAGDILELPDWSNP